MACAVLVEEVAPGKERRKSLECSSFEAVAKSVADVDLRARKQLFSNARGLRSPAQGPSKGRVHVRGSAVNARRHECNAPAVIEERKRDDAIPTIKTTRKPCPGSVDKEDAIRTEGGEPGSGILWRELDLERARGPHQRRGSVRTSAAESGTGRHVLLHVNSDARVRRRARARPPPRARPGSDRRAGCPPRRGAPRARAARPAPPTAPPVPRRRGRARAGPCPRRGIRRAASPARRATG